MERDAMYTYVGDETPIDLLGEAWLFIVDLDFDPSGKSPNPALQDFPGVGYLSEDWCKMTQRAIRGFAERNERPDRWPWTQREFDHFKWASDVPVVDGEVVPERRQLEG